ncbi:hypothetical protein BY458DRAFT_467345 [Sporodiniella umbellata]|nr:hypothetical protein BY458DRAFT_467345 [Sporodiniella umbellata]
METLTEQPVKIRKKPGRKPNPASPALRKAQNRAAQRAFRERKERHMRDLEIAIKQIREQRDTLSAENEQLKADSDILRSENWYLKGIVLTLQLVCFQHNLVIPQHGPYVNEQALSLLAQSIPEPISAYISVNANNKVPIPSKPFGYRAIRQRDRHLSSGSIVITKEGVHTVSEHQSPTSPVNFKPALEQDTVHPLQHIPEGNMPPLSPTSKNHELKQSPKPIMLREEPVTSNLAAIQALRLRLRLQSACTNMDAVPFAIQPTLLQLTVPHDPRIDLIPTPHMRDRMILFRDQFDLDDCFRCLLSGSVFHGGDPAVAANWQLPEEFFGKYWFLTIDYDLQRTTNQWRRLQGLDDIDFKDKEKNPEDSALEKKEQELKEQELKERETSQLPGLEKVPSLDYNDISALLGINFQRIATMQQQQNMNSYASSFSSDCSVSSNTQSSLSAGHEEDENSFEPIQLTDGCSLSYLKSQKKKPIQQHHQHSTINIKPLEEPVWDEMMVEPMEEDYDMMMSTMIDLDENN